MNGQSVTLAKTSLNFETSLECERERRGGGGGGELLKSGKSLTLEERLIKKWLVLWSATGILLWQF